MAVTFVRDHTLASQVKVAGTTVNLLVAPAVPAGNLLIAYILFDNAATASKPIVSSIARQAGETNTWTFLGAARSTSTSAGAFASGEMWAIKTTVQWAAASYVVTLDTSVTMKGTQVQEFSGTEATLRSTVGTNYSATTTAASATTTGTNPVIGDLAIGFLFGSNVAAQQAGDTDTTGGAWSTRVGVGSTGSSGATNNFGIVQYKVLTAASHQTYNNSAAMTAGNGSIVAVLQATPVPAVTLAAYRFYADGTESGAVALAAQDANYTADVGSADANLSLRVRLQSTNALAIPATDDWDLQYQIHVGPWITVSPGSPNVCSYSSVNLTNAAATTSRLTGGTGSFVAGKVSEIGSIGDLGWAGNNHTELLYSLTLKQTGLADLDTLSFRVLKNGSTNDLTYTQTPTIFVNKPRASVATLTDAFDTIDPLKWSIWGTGVSAVSGELFLIPTIGSTTYVGMSSVERYNFLDARIFIKIVDAGDQTLASWEAAALILNNVAQTSHVQFHVATHYLYVHATNGGTIAYAAYNPVNHHFVAFRHSVSTSRIYFETSPDGVTWNAFATEGATPSDMALPGGFNPTDVLVQFSAGHFNTEAGKGPVLILDSLNIADTPTGPVDYTRDYTDGTGLGDISVAKAVDAPRTDALALADAAVVTRVVTHAATDSLGLTDSAAVEVARTLTYSASDTAGLSDTAAEDVALNRIDLAKPTDTASREAVLAGADALALTDSVVASRVIAFAASDALGLTDTIATVISRTLDRAETLGLTDTINVALTPGGPFTPAHLSGLTGWYDVSQISGVGNGEQPDSWPDLSGQGRHEVNPNPLNRPTLHTGVLNGLPVLRFDGSDDSLLSTGATFSVGHVFVVAKYSAATFVDYDGMVSAHTSLPEPNGGLILTGYQGVAVFYPTPGTGLAYYYNGTSLPSGFWTAPMNTFAVMSASRAELWNNLYLRIGRDRDQPGRHWAGDIAEVVTYDRVLSDLERIQVEDYLHEKWLSAPAPIEQDIADPLGLTDTITVAVSRGLNLADTVSITDTRAVVTSATRTDVVSPTDTTTLARALSQADPMGLTDTISIAKSLAINVSDLLRLTDTAGTPGILAVNAQDSLNLYDQHAISAAGATVLDLADAMNLGDTLARTGIFTRSFADTIALGDIRSLAIAWSRADAEALLDLRALVGTVNRIDELAMADARTVAMTLARIDAAGTYDLLAAEILAGITGWPKVWDGTDWVSKPAKVGNETRPVKVWTGSEWKTV